MNLHLDQKFFSDTLRVASKHLDIRLDFVEKDYWITLVLSRLAESRYVEETVFKGGTSLSKAYRLIDRFSEDVDLAITTRDEKSGNEIKTIIRNVERTITKELVERPTEGITSKGSRFRKTVFEYVTSDKSNTNNKLILEVNSFANPFPFQKCTIQSMVYEFLSQAGRGEYIDQYNLYPFAINVLSIEQTLLEKLVSLIRFSFDSEPIISLSGKIRHFYDLYFLMQRPECIDFSATQSFRQQFFELLQHDRENFDEPPGWKERPIEESPLTNRFEEVWRQIKDHYQKELTALAYRPIPDESDVALMFMDLTRKLLLNW